MPLSGVKYSTFPVLPHLNLTSPHIRYNYHYPLYRWGNKLKRDRIFSRSSIYKGVEFKPTVIWVQCSLSLPLSPQADVPSIQPPGYPAYDSAENSSSTCLPPAQELVVAPLILQSGSKPTNPPNNANSTPKSSLKPHPVPPVHKDFFFSPHTALWTQSLVTVYHFYI